MISSEINVYVRGCKADGLKECSYCKEILCLKCLKKDYKKKGPPMNAAVSKKTVKQSESRKKL